MSNGINRVILIGRLGKDPEMRFMPNGKAVASFSMATSEKWKDKTTGENNEQTEWHNVTAFDKLAEIIGQYVKKGSNIYIEGKLKTDKYQKDGQDHYSTKIIASTMQMLDGKSENRRDQSDQAAQQEDLKLSDFCDDVPF